MVVKEKRGRRRYILFSHSNINRKTVEKFIKSEIKSLGGKITTKLISFDSQNGILRVDHMISVKCRDVINKNSDLGLSTIKTSGTLKSLGKT